MTDDLERLEAALSNAREDDCGNDELCMEAAMRLAELRLNLRLTQKRLDAVLDRAAAAEAEVERLRNPPEEYCAKCGAPKSNHPYRHPFQPRVALRQDERGVTREAERDNLRERAEMAEEGLFSAYALGVYDQQHSNENLDPRKTWPLAHAEQEAILSGVASALRQDEGGE